MEHNRIQKLLLSEYCEFSDTILVESPFAETTREGHGLREVALGLTPTRLIIAADIFNKNTDFICPPDLDPSIESFELVSIYPLEWITLSIFRRRCRRTLKARLIDGRLNYYELGGMERKGMFWTLWCEQIQNLALQKADGSSLSETTAASSSSASTLYLLSSGIEVEGNPKGVGEKTVCRIWTHYGGAGDGMVPIWPQKDLYLGPAYNELNNGSYTPIPVRFAGASLDDVRYELNDRSPGLGISKEDCHSWPVNPNFRNSKKNHRTGGLCDVLFTREHGQKCHKANFTTGPTHTPSNCRCYVDSRWSTETENRSLDWRTNAKMTDAHQNNHGVSGDPTAKISANRCSTNKSQQRRKVSLAQKLSRFGFGVPENCSSGLCLAPDVVQRVAYPLTDPYKLIEGGVTVWESDARRRRELTRNKHPRRYGLSTAAHFLHALGPWSVQPGERESVQCRRALSVVTIRRQTLDSELKLPVSRRQLAASVSATALEPGKYNAIGAATRGRVVLFWTPEYWYRPRAAVTAYRELRQHLALLRDFQTDKARTSRRKFFYRRRQQTDCSGDIVVGAAEEKSSCILGRIFSSNGGRDNNGKSAGKLKRNRNDRERTGSTSQLKRLLRMDLRITAWDLDSTTIARQLTLIDRDLFLRVPALEIEILVYQRSSRNTPNLGAWIAFGHRISCLAASEILAVKQLDMRTRMIARMINAADKCYGAGNFHSCRSILAGLQSPAIYRLKSTWSRLRTHHATKYDAMERLCKIYRSPHLRRYHKAWFMAEHNPPYMPYVGDLLNRLLGVYDTDVSSSKATFVCTNSRPKINNSSKSNSRCTKYCSTNRVETSDYQYRTGPRQKRSSQAMNEDVREPTTEERRGLARRILSLAIMRMKYKKNLPTQCQDENLLWTARQQELARKVYDRWRNYILGCKLVAENTARLNNMDPRKKRVLVVATWLANCQRAAQNYDYPGHSFAWEFLLKARYREDRDNFFISLKLEPPPST